MNLQEAFHEAYKRLGLSEEQWQQTRTIVAKMSPTGEGNLQLLPDKQEECIQMFVELLQRVNKLPVSELAAIAESAESELKTQAAQN